MAGPIVSLIPGYKSSSVCANMCAEECQKAVFPSSLSQVCKTNSASSRTGVTDSTVFPFIEADKTFRARPAEILLATSKGVTPDSNSRTEPSGRVILIILF